MWLLPTVVLALALASAVAVLSESAVLPNEYFVKWNQQSAAPSGLAVLPREGHSATLVGRSLYVYGGVKEPEHKAFAELLRLDLDDYRWAKMTTLREPPPALMDHTATLVEGDGKKQIFILGGLTLRADNIGGTSNDWRCVRPC